MSSSTINHRRGSHSEFSQRRSGFTLTELLIGITIIGLLVGLLAVAGAGVIDRAREFSVSAEIIQLNQATENFNTQFGFYPPSFEQFKRTVNTVDSAPLGIVNSEAAQLLPFLNKISPNHQELAPSPVRAGYTRLDDWWEFVGCNLDQTTSLQFWLSGLFQNKQFPLTGGLTPADSGVADLYLPVAYNSDVFINSGIPVPAGRDRQVFYEFDAERYVPITIQAGTATLFPAAQYVMEFGKTNGDLFYIYRDAASYLPVVQPAAAGSPLDRDTRTATPAPIMPASAFSITDYLSNPNHRGPAYYFVEGPVGAPFVPVFANPNTFQIITFGLDGDPGVPPAISPETLALRGLLFNGALPPTNPNSVQVQLSDADDNLCNFADGRLDKFLNEQR